MRCVSLVSFVLATVVSLSAIDPGGASDPVAVTVHEWGTFTSIAGADGKAIEWLPLHGPDDLPCFVDRMDFRGGGKANTWSTVRMETPVVYFYAADDTEVNVRVRFRQGLITEWFPRATVAPAGVPASGADIGRPVSEFVGDAHWPTVKIVPRAEERYLTESKPSHYYSARATDAVPIQVGSQTEKFLFYRGIGGFAPPIVATVAADGTIAVRNTAGAALGDVILVENQGGRTAFHVSSIRSASTTMEMRTLESRPVASLKQALQRILVARGLYEREASAMIATWDDSWFEEGTRLLYIVPRAFVDSILPLEVTPTPADTARVFVGRMELMTPGTLGTVRDALVRDERQTLARYGRFLYLLINRVAETSPSIDRRFIDRGLQFVMSSWRAPLSGCR